jgi:hypothetical protein
MGMVGAMFAMPVASKTLSAVIACNPKDAGEVVQR